MKQTINNLITAGHSIIPLMGDKRPAVAWKTYQDKQPDAGEITTWLEGGMMDGLGLVCGKIQVVDVDTKHNPSGHAEFIEAMTEAEMDWVLPLATIQRTQSGGYHYAWFVGFYEGQDTPGNLKLAVASGRVEAFLETRGKGGYIAIAPTKGYKVTQGNFAAMVEPSISVDIWETILTVCRSLDTRVIEDYQTARQGNIGKDHDAGSPGNDYSMNGGTGELRKLLEPCGWTSRNGRHWTRPGKQAGACSATWDHQGSNRFYVFSSSTELEPNRGYDLFGLRARLYHGGDLAVCAKALAAEGWGKKPTKVTSRHVDDGWGNPYPISGDDEGGERQTAHEKAKSRGKLLIDGEEWELHEPPEKQDHTDWLSYAHRFNEDDWGNDMPETLKASPGANSCGEASNWAESLTTAADNQLKGDKTDEERRLERILLEHRIDLLTEAPEFRPILFLTDKSGKKIPVLTEGNIVAVTAESKSGKTHHTAALVARLVAGRHREVDTLGWVGDNDENGALIYFDFEQSKFHSWDLFCKHMLRRAGVEKADKPDWLHYYNFVGISVSELRPLLRQALKLGVEKHGTIKLIVLDGYADLLKSVNDEDESVALVGELMAHAQHHETGIIGIIHKNAGSDNSKARGHVGSQLERKSETVIQIEIDKKAASNVAFTRLARNEPLHKSHALRWSWDGDEGMFMTQKTSEFDDDEPQKVEKTDDATARKHQARVTGMVDFARKNRQLNTEIRSKDLHLILSKMTPPIRSKPTRLTFIEEAILGDEITFIEGKTAQENRYKIVEKVPGEM